MTQDLIIGIIGIGVGLGLLLAGMPRGGASPRFLQFSAAPVVYTPLIMIFLALGAAEVIAALF